MFFTLVGVRLGKTRLSQFTEQNNNPLFMCTQKALCLIYPPTFSGEDITVFSSLVRGLVKERKALAI